MQNVIYTLLISGQKLHLVFFSVPSSMINIKVILLRSPATTGPFPDGTALANHVLAYASAHVKAPARTKDQFLIFDFVGADNCSVWISRTTGVVTVHQRGALEPARRRVALRDIARGMRSCAQAFALADFDASLVVDQCTTQWVHCAVWDRFEVGDTGVHVRRHKAEVSVTGAFIATHWNEATMKMKPSGEALIYRST